MYEDGKPSKGFPVVELYLEEKPALDTSWEEDIARKLFGDLNRGLFGLPDDDNVIIISDSEEEEKVCEDDRIDVDVVPSSPRDSPAPSTFTAANDDAPDAVQDASSDGEDGAGTP
jgi:hypothetical protein